jgi:hypothetical protein
MPLTRQFFFVLLVWAAIFSIWTFTTLLALNVRAAARVALTVDSQHVVVLVLYVLLYSPPPVPHLTEVADRGCSRYLRLPCSRPTSCSLARTKLQSNTSSRAR